MIIQCTACDKKFSVPDSAITASGRLVQCSSCKNQWTQYPIKKEKPVKKIFVPITKSVKKKSAKKNKGPIPYSKEYMQQKWGSGVQKYASDKGLTKKTKKKSQQHKIKVSEDFEKPGFGFFGYLIILSVLSVTFVGILDISKTQIIARFPLSESYIEHFFETIENFKIFILDLYK
tara:strand:- start:41 stop:565 length:525 start_codon:yes stop_codon:yes gene_type:complete